MKSLG